MKHGFKIRTLRTMKNMKQDELAKLAGIGVHVLSDIENDKISPKADILEKIVGDGLGLSMEDYYALGNNFVFTNNHSKIEQQGSIHNETIGVPKELLERMLNLIQKQGDLIVNANKEKKNEKDASG